MCPSVLRPDLHVIDGEVRKVVAKSDSRHTQSCELLFYALRNGLAAVEDSSVLYYAMSSAGHKRKQRRRA